MTPKTSLANSILDLNQITQPIIGETCHQVAFSYGDELLLDFGEMTAYNHPKLAHLRKGSWQLSTRATPWYLMLKKGVSWSSSMLVNNENTVEFAKIQLQCLENKKLTNFVTLANSNEMKLILSFEGDLNYELILEPDLEDDSGLAYWELLMPNEQILIVGPGLFWECKSIHEPY
ncbi:MAG: hypothetical protein AN487_06560 [Anabaena sp. CRKS33]|jgi:hypothetical protein|nr:MAG: hypothetical protein AN487_06560 [Anabaena sp. CRKS33]